MDPMGPDRTETGLTESTFIKVPRASNVTTFSLSNINPTHLDKDWSLLTIYKALYSLLTTLEESVRSI